MIFYCSFFGMQPLDFNDWEAYRRIKKQMDEERDSAQMSVWSSIHNTKQDDDEPMTESEALKQAKAGIARMFAAGVIRREEKKEEKQETWRDRPPLL